LKKQILFGQAIREMERQEIMSILPLASLNDIVSAAVVPEVQIKHHCCDICARSEMQQCSLSNTLSQKRDLTFHAAAGAAAAAAAAAAAVHGLAPVR
jgi:hypothetical protein